MVRVSLLHLCDTKQDGSAGKQGLGWGKLASWRFALTFLSCSALIMAGSSVFALMVMFAVVGYVLRPHRYAVCAYMEGGREKILGKNIFLCCESE